MSFDPSVSRFLSQVREALELALAGSRDPRLVDGSLRDVRVAPGSGPLVVVVTAPEAASSSVAAALEDARGHLRSEIAASIHRKHTPELSFVVLPEGALDAGEEDPWR